MPRKTYLFALFLLLAGCYDTELVFEDQYRIVVQSYLYVGVGESETILSSMISFGNDSTGGDPISGAVITLTGDSEEWIYGEIDTVPGTYMLENAPEFVPGEPYTLHIETSDYLLEASTVIPESPPEVNMSATSISIPRVADMRDITWPDPIVLTWENPQGESFFVQIENIESNPSTIRPDPPDDFPHKGGGFVFQMVTRPTSGESYSITPMDLTHYGTHRIIFYRVNEEYANLYQSLDQDSRELNEPFSNVKNGLGIFTAFNSDTLYFEVTM